MFLKINIYALNTENLGTYMGCFKDSTFTDMTGFSFMDQAMSVDACLGNCSRYNYKYAGIQYFLNQYGLPSTESL